MCGWWSSEVYRGLQLHNCSDEKDCSGRSAPSLRHPGVLHWLLLHYSKSIHIPFIVKTLNSKSHVSVDPSAPASSGYIDSLVQDCSNSIANALESLQSYTKPSIYSFTISPLVIHHRPNWTFSSNKLLWWSIVAKTTSSWHPMLRLAHRENQQWYCKRIVKNNKTHNKPNLALITW